MLRMAVDEGVVGHGERGTAVQVGVVGDGNSFSHWQ